SGRSPAIGDLDRPVGPTPEDEAQLPAGQASRYHHLAAGADHLRLHPDVERQAETDAGGVRRGVRQGAGAALPARTLTVFSAARLAHLGIAALFGIFAPIFLYFVGHARIRVGTGGVLIAMG